MPKPSTGARMPEKWAVRSSHLYFEKYQTEE